MQETQVRFLGKEDSLEKRMATHSSILAWEIPWTEEPGGLQSMGLQAVKHHWTANIFTLFIPSPMVSTSPDSVCASISALKRLISTIFLDFIYMLQRNLHSHLSLNYTFSPSSTSFPNSHTAKRQESTKQGGIRLPQELIKLSRLSYFMKCSWTRTLVGGNRQILWLSLYMLISY